MAINYVWVGFIIIGLLTAIVKSFMAGNLDLFTVIFNGLIESADLSFSIMIGLAGAMTFWMGVMQIGNDSGLIQNFSKIISPFFKVLFPKIPKGHPAFGSMTMNFSANMLGLDNAATPLGLEAMKDMQSLNPNPKEATNAQIMFLALNTAGVTLIPTTIIAMRQTMAVKEGLTNFNAADIFLPTLIVTFLSFLVALLITSIFHKNNIFKLPVLLFIIFFGGLILGLNLYVKSGNPEEIGKTIGAIGALIIMGFIILFILSGVKKKINVYDSFIEGAQGGFKLVIDIAPFLVAMLLAISIFRNAGCMDALLSVLAYSFEQMGMDTRFVDALPVALMKPLSGGGAKGLMINVMETHGVKSFAGTLASIMQGSTETTFYVLAVYFGSVGIKNIRHALWVGLLADFAAMIISILVAYYYFR